MYRHYIRHLETTVLFVPINGLQKGTGILLFIYMSKSGMHSGFLLKYNSSVILNRSGEDPKGKAVLKKPKKDRYLLIDMTNF